jgi:uncharacterized phage infection (PIP) family protein YhgE
MDLYGLNEARSQGNSHTQDVSLYNEQIRQARDDINNTLDAEKITAQGNLRGQEGQDLQDKIIYDFHDAISGGNVAGSLNKYYQTLKGTADTISDTYTKVKGAVDTASDTANKAKQAFGEARGLSDSVAQATYNQVNRIRGLAQIRSGGATGGVSVAQPLTEEQQSSFLDESARAGGVDARPTPSVTPSVTPEVNNRPKTNEPVSANENTPDIPKPTSSATEELSESVLNRVSQAKTAVSKVGAGLRVVGDVGGAISTYEMFKNGLAKNKDGSYDVAGDVGQIATSLGTGLDILGAIIPGAGAGFEALAAVAQGVGQVATTIDTHNKDEQATTQAQTETDDIEQKRTAQLSGLQSIKPLSATVNTIASSGLVGTVSNHLSSVTGGGTF